MLKTAIRELSGLCDAIGKLEPEITAASARMVDTLAGGGKILACGNGGSAAEAQHFVTELVGRYRTNRPSLPAIFLGGDVGQMSCIANDFSPHQVFSRPLSALASPPDLLFVLSTSGSSENIVACLQTARELGLSSVALLGKGGGPAAGLATLPVIVPSSSTARIQEIHLLLVHLFCDVIEDRFAVPSDKLPKRGRPSNRI